MPVYLPGDRPQRGDYRDEIAAIIERANPDAHRQVAEEKGDNEPDMNTTAALSHGTAVEGLQNGTLNIIWLLTALMVRFLKFYTLFDEVGRDIRTNDERVIKLADEIVRVRLLIIAINAQEHINERIDEYIARHVVRLLPQN